MLYVQTAMYKACIQIFFYVQTAIYNLLFTTKVE